MEPAAPIVEAPRPPPPPPPRTLCWSKGTPTPIAEPAAPTGTCRALDEAALLRAEQRVRREASQGVKQPSRLYIDVQCDPTARELRDVVYEDARSDTGALRIVQVREAGDAWEVRVLESTHSKSQRRVELRGATLPGKDLRAAVEAARTALHVAPNVVQVSRAGSTPQALDGAPTGFRVYQRATVEDAEGRIADRVYAGPESMSSQRARIPLALAIDAIDDALAKSKIKLGPIEDGEGERAMFVRRLRHAATLPADEAWVLERYVNLATTLGTVDALPVLAAVLASPNHTQLRDSALDAITVISGWNPRVDTDDKPRSLDLAAATAADECAATSPPSS